jgi:hypothetical protein
VYYASLTSRGNIKPVIDRQRNHFSMISVPEASTAAMHVQSYQGTSPDGSPAPSRANSPMAVDPPVDSPSPTQSFTAPSENNHLNDSEFIEIDLPPQSPCHIRSVPTSRSSSPQPIHHPTTPIVEPTTTLCTSALKKGEQDIKLQEWLAYGENVNLRHLHRNYFHPQS